MPAAYDAAALAADTATHKVDAFTAIGANTPRMAIFLPGLNPKI
jgi:hypothetical protein